MLLVYTGEYKFADCFRFYLSLHVLLVLIFGIFTLRKQRHCVCTPFQAGIESISSPAAWEIVQATIFKTGCRLISHLISESPDKELPS